MKKTVLVLVMLSFLLSIIPVDSFAEEKAYNWGPFSFDLPDGYEVVKEQPIQFVAKKGDYVLTLLISDLSTLMKESIDDPEAALLALNIMIKSQQTSAMLGVVSSGEDPYFSGTCNNAAYSAISCFTNSEEYPQVTLFAIMKGFHIIYGISMCPEFSDSQTEAINIINTIVNAAGDQIPEKSEKNILIEDLKMVVKCPDNSFSLSRGMNDEDLSAVGMTSAEVDETLISSGSYLHIYELSGKYVCYVTAMDSALYEDISSLSEDSLNSLMESIISNPAAASWENPSIYETADSSGKYIKASDSDDSQSLYMIYFFTIHNHKIITIAFSFGSKIDNEAVSITDSIINSIQYY